MKSVFAALLTIALVVLSWTFAVSTPASAYSSQYSQTVIVDAPVAVGSAVIAGTASCVAYQLSASASTPAGTYSTAVVYTAVPTF